MVTQPRISNSTSMALGWLMVRIWRNSCLKLRTRAHALNLQPPMSPWLASLACLHDWLAASWAGIGLETVSLSARNICVPGPRSDCSNHPHPEDWISDGFRSIHALMQRSLICETSFTRQQISTAMEAMETSPSVEISCSWKTRLQSNNTLSEHTLFPWSTHSTVLED